MGSCWCANPEFELYKVFLLEDVSFDLNVIKNRRKTLNDIKNVQVITIIK